MADSTVRLLKADPSSSFLDSLSICAATASCNFETLFLFSYTIPISLIIKHLYILFLGDCDLMPAFLALFDEIDLVMKSSY